VSDHDGSNLIRVTDASFGSVGRPRWSPDGRHIAFAARTHKGDEIFVANSIRNMETLPASLGLQGVRPSWSVDGESLYFTSTQSPSIQTVRISAGAEITVSPPILVKSGASEALESPDGNALFYVKAGTSELWALPKSGGEERRVADGIRTSWRPVKDAVWDCCSGESFYRKSNDMNQIDLIRYARSFFLGTRASPDQAALGDHVRVINLKTNELQQWQLPDQAQAMSGPFAENAFVYMRIDALGTDIAVVDRFDRWNVPWWMPVLF
jgi:hypothetical protein